MLVKTVINSHLMWYWLMTRWLSYLLIMLVATQSVLAMADIHQAHQSDEGHLEFADDHKPATGSATTAETSDDSVDSKQAPLSTVDCQHCCHCHASQLNLLSDIYSQLNFDGNKPTLAALRAAAPSSQPSSLYRPPRT